MTGQLLLITIGPVQDFIAQARRTRDLWYGSHLLSELSRNVARSLAIGGAKLIFPALDKDAAELLPCLAPVRQNGAPPLSIANKIMAEVPVGLDAVTLAESARDELQRFWRYEIAQTVKNQIDQSGHGLLANNIDFVWIEQVETAIEFSAAWVPLDDGYDAARKSVERAIGARKNLRDFEPWIHDRTGAPKSSLDGARVSILAERTVQNAGVFRRYRIGVGEQLDALGLIKRAGGQTDQSISNHESPFVPLVNVALASWIAKTKETAPDQAFRALDDACKTLQLAQVNRNVPCAMQFPFDASIFLETRLWPIFQEQGLLEPPTLMPSDTREAAEWKTGWKLKAQQWAADHVRPIVSHMQDPQAYVACLVADGDGMSALIETITSAKEPASEHRDFSRSLARFAATARSCVEDKHQGSLVYAGGADVVAFLPVSTALTCADELRLSFLECMEPTWERHGRSCKQPTLSVGIGIGHVMEGMGDLLNLGRAAEKQAKGAALKKESRDRNALAVIVDKRSGGTLSWRAQWCEWSGNPKERMRLDVDLLQDKLSSRNVYEIAKIIARLPKPAPDGIDPFFAKLLQLEVERTLAPLTLAEVGISIDDEGSYKAVHGIIAAWVNRMLIARALADAEPREKKVVVPGAKTHES